MQTTDIIPTIKVKPWGEGQGEFVEINADDFDPAVHKLHDEHPAPKKAEKAHPAPKKAE